MLSVASAPKMLGPTASHGPTETGPAATTRQRVLRALRDNGVMSRAALSRETGLSASTISALVRELARDGLVVDAGEQVPPAGQSAGRPGAGLALDPRAAAAIGIDFGFRHVRVILCDLAHRVIGTSKAELPEHHTANVGVEVAAGLVTGLVADAALAPGTVVGAGIGVPGPINRPPGTVIPPRVLPGWEGEAAVRAFAERLGVPAAIDNDANLAALGELVWGAGRSAESFLLLKLHRGVGGAVVVDGRIMRGAAGGAGEIGHVTIDRRGAVCRCGKRGCLETYASIPAVLAALEPTHGTISLTELADLARRDDPAVMRVLNDVGEIIGDTVAMVWRVLEPSKIILVGALVDATGPVLIDAVTQALIRDASPGDRLLPDVLPGALQSQAGALGGAALVLRETGWLPTGA